MVTGTGPRTASLLAAGLIAGGAVAGCGSSSATSSISSLQSQYESVATSVLPSVVQITTSTSTGSGVVYDSDGDIVTNAHVVSGASTVKVTRASDGHTFSGRVLGLSRADDVAVVRVTDGASELHPAAFSTSSVRTGQIVLAMGSPLGLTGTVTQGIISGENRTVSEASASGQDATTLKDAIQTSAPINSGNSGGPLVDLSDQVTGITTAAARDPEAGAAPGIGFAIPAATAKTIAEKIIAAAK
jgi:putative serine protease PepD